MKRRIEIISTLIVMILVVILAILLTNKKENKPLKFLTNGSNIAYMYDNGDGNYVLGNSNEWTNGKYALNVGYSICNGDSNPNNILDWDSVNKIVLITSNENINCTLYFNKVYTQKEFYEKYVNDDVGDGELLKHTTSLPNSAGDDGYRYSGNNPRNFICFGPGSEDYNKGVSGARCEDENLYRMIGYIPVQLSNGETEFRIKVIKSEYATYDDLGREEVDGTNRFHEEYKKLKRVNADTIEGFSWNYNSTHAIWGSNLLYKTLNDNANSYLSNLNEWADKIEIVQWNIGGSDKDELPKAKEVYEEEKASSHGASSQVSAQIGLMYASDYGFASSKENWTKSLGLYGGNNGYSTDENRKNNWLFNAIEEWIILPELDHSSAYNISSWGNIFNGDDIDDAYGVRPVFYLKPDVNIVCSESTDGTDTDPYKVS